MNWKCEKRIILSYVDDVVADVDRVVFGKESRQVEESIRSELIGRSLDI